MKNSQHLDNPKHPFNSSFKTTQGKASSKAVHPTAAGTQGKFRSANAAMKGK